MNGDEDIPASISYAGDLLNRWSVIMDYGQAFRKAYMDGNIDTELLHDYVSRLTRFWLELMPKVKNRQEFGELAKQFMGFEKYYYDPDKLLGFTKKKEDLKEAFKKDKDISLGEEDIFKLESILREVMEKLGLTDFGR